MTDNTPTTAIEVKETVQEPTAESRYFVIRTLRKAVDTITETLKDYKNTVIKPVMETGKTVKEGITGDVRLVMEELREKTKSLKPESSILDAAKEKITCGFNKIKEQLPVPTKKDIDSLNHAMENLTRKVETLEKTTQAA